MTSKTVKYSLGKPESTYIQGLCIFPGCTCKQVSKGKQSLGIYVGEQRFDPFCQKHKTGGQGYLKFKKDQCEFPGCIFIALNKGELDVHHWDEDRYNNNESNLITVCPTHHRIIHKRKLTKESIYKMTNDYARFQDSSPATIDGISEDILNRDGDPQVARLNLLRAIVKSIEKENEHSSIN
jgi:hypothetical protein